MKRNATRKNTVRMLTVLSNRLRRKLDTASIRGVYSGAQGRVLSFLLANSDVDIFQKDIEEAYGLRSPSATQILSELEKKGLICRQSVDYDGRLKKIVVTEKAEAYRQQVLDDLTALENQVCNGLTEEELVAFSSIAEKIIRNLS